MKGGKNVQPKIRIETDETAQTEVIIRCKSLTPEIQQLVRLLEGKSPVSEEILLTLAEREYFIPLKSILFFEAQDGRTAAHTGDGMFYTDKTLSELTSSLPPCFFRGSKSCILNLNKVSSLHRELTGICEVFFAGSVKKVYVSRMYYKPFRERLNEIHLGTAYR